MARSGGVATTKLATYRDLASVGSGIQGGGGSIAWFSLDVCSGPVDVGARTSVAVSRAKTDWFNNLASLGAVISGDLAAFFKPENRGGAVPNLRVGLVC